MNLTEFLVRKGIAPKEFAEQIGTTDAAVRLYAFHGRVPTPKIMRRVIKATDGQVMPNDFFANDNEEKNGGDAA